MKELEGFISPDIAGVPVSAGDVAYQVDAKKNDMRQLCGMDGSACCDYVLLRKDSSVVLIEDTRLGATVEDLEKEFGGLERDKEQEHILRTLRRENVLKIYGTLLMLCRLCSQFSSVQETLAKKEYDFWLVATDGNVGANYAKGRNLQTRLEGTLGKVVSGINILSLDNLREIFQPA